MFWVVGGTSAATVRPWSLAEGWRMLSSLRKLTAYNTARVCPPHAAAISAGRAAIVVLQVCCCEPVLGLTDRRTPYHCIDPAAPHTVRTVPIIEVSLHARLRSRQSPGYATDTYEVSLVRLLASSGDCTVVRLCRRDVFRTIRQGALLTSTMHSIIQIRQSLTCEH